MSPTALIPALDSFSEDGVGGGAGAGQEAGLVTGGALSDLLDHFRHATTTSDIVCALENLIILVKGDVTAAPLTRSV